MTVRVSSLSLTEGQHSPLSTGAPAHQMLTKRATYRTKKRKSHAQHPHHHRSHVEEDVEFHEE